MRAHWSDGHLYSGDRLRKLQAKHYFLIDTGAGEKVFLNLYDADREFDIEQVRNAVAKRSGLYAAYKDTMDRHFYFNQIVLLARKP